jgi:hypothetical protein
MAYPIFTSGRIRLPTERTPSERVRRRIAERAHRIAVETYHQAVEKMLEEWRQRKLKAAFIEFWTDHEGDD